MSWNANVSKKIEDYKKQGKTVYTAVGSDGKLHYSIYDQGLANHYAGLSSTSSGSDLSNVDSFDSYYDRILADNQQSAKQQMDFQERMSNTAHQREVKDLIAAGLNPVLSAGGSGASSPSGSYANIDSSMVSAKANARLQHQLLDKQLKNAKDINKAQIDAQKAINKYNTDIGAQVSLSNAQTSAAASRYAVDNPNNWEGALLKFLEGSSNSGKDTSKIQDKGKNFFENLEKFVLGLRTDKKKDADGF